MTASIPLPRVEPWEWLEPEIAVRQEISYVEGGCNDPQLFSEPE
jgi:hypothetical protein